MLFLVGLVYLVGLINCALLTGNVTSNGEFNTNSVQIELVSIDTKKIQRVFLRANGEFQTELKESGTYELTLSSTLVNLYPNRYQVSYLEDDIKVYSHPLGEAVSFDTENELPLIVNVGANRDFFEKRKKGMFESGPLATIVNNPVYMFLAMLAVGVGIAPTIISYFDPDFNKRWEDDEGDKKSK